MSLDLSGIILHKNDFLSLKNLREVLNSTPDGESIWIILQKNICVN